MAALDDLPRFHAETRAEWRGWLTRNAKATGVWVVTWKKETALPRIDAATISEEALCFGWVDSLPRKLDAKRSMLLVTPRKPSSKWSKLNKDRVAKLEREGKMTARGLAAVEEAKRRGTWEALDEVEALAIPPDLAREFRARPPAAKNFDAFPRSVKRGILEWITSAKKPETRAKRVLETASRAAKNERANQWR